MDDSTSTPAAQGGLSAQRTAARRVVGAAYLREEDCRLGMYVMDDPRPPFPITAPFPSSSPFPSSAPTPCASSGGNRPPRPSVATSTKKKRAPPVAPHPRPRAPPPGGELPRRQDAPSPGGSLPRQFIDSDVRCSASASSVRYVDDEFGLTRLPFFDWTPDTATEDPRPSISQPFMNLLTQDQDADLRLLMQEDATPSKRQPKRGSNYNLEEDIQVCKFWINISNDPIVRNDQPGTTYWERVAQDFHKNKDFQSDRSANSIEHRCQTILKECMRFHGHFEEIERCHPSGVPYQEHLLQAQTLYSSKNKGKRCPFIDCWLVFAALPSWNKSKNKRSSKSSNLYLNLPAGSEGDEGVQDTMQAEETSSKKPRPPGRKQSKEKVKRGEGDDDEYKDMMKSLIELKAKEMQRKEAVDQRKLELEERRLQWKQEEKIMFCDVSKMDEADKAYVIARRVEMARMAELRASLGSGSVSESAGASVNGSSM
ncbi:hypothetical protein EJB05_04531, partial [Eragrostis curvula]